MSYDITLKDPVSRKTIELETNHFMQGGTYAVGGTTEAWLNITWNYADFYYEAQDGGIRAIYGKSGAESIPILENMIAQIRAKYPALETHPNYWEATAGNAIRPLYQLLALAKMRPDGIWEGD